MTSRSRTIRINIVGDGTSAQLAFGNLNRVVGATTGVFGKLAGTAGVIGVALGLKRVGTEAVNLAKDFESNLAKIEGLVGVNREVVDGWGDDLKALAPKVGRPLGELADALFFVASAGIQGSAAIEVVEMAAKAAAAGLGDTKTVADLVTSAMNAYGAETLSAAQATDDLTMAVRLGKLEPAELASAMGQVLPLSSAMGVSFDQVAAAMAAMSRTGTNAAQASTQLRGIFSQLLSPSAQARNALRDVGLSVEGVQKSLREDGLLATLQMLVDALGGNVTATEAVFGNIRALSGVMDMLGGNVAATEQIFNQMTDTLGTTDEAFQVVSETAEFKMAAASAAMGVALTELGGEILPILVAAVEALVPILIVVAEIISGLIIAVRLLGTAVGWLAGEVKLGDDAWAAFASTLSSSQDRATTLVEWLAALAHTGDLNADSVKRLHDEYGITNQEMAAAAAIIASADDSLGILDDTTRDFIDTLIKQREESLQTHDDFQLLRLAQQHTQEATEDLTDATEDLAEGTGTLAQRLRDATVEQRSLAAVMREAADPVFAATKALERMNTAQEKLTAVQRDGKATTGDIAQAQLDYAGAVLEAQGALDGLANSPQAVNDAVTALSTALQISQSEVRNLLAELGILDGTVVRAVVQVDAPTISYLEQKDAAGISTLVPSVTGRRTLGRGGIAVGPTDAVVGEDGREAVIPLNDQGMQFLIAAIAAAIPTQPQRQGPDTQTVIVELDGDTIARATVDPLVKLIRLKTGMR